MIFIFWFSLIAVFYTYIGYPLTVYLVSLIHRKPVYKKYVYPTISILLPVENIDEQVIEKKIRSLIMEDYPHERMEVLVGTNGAYERVNDIISEQTDKKIKFIQVHTKNRRALVLNELAAKAEGEILVFTNVQHEFDKDFLKQLVSNFADEKIGCVGVDMLFGNVHNKTSPGLGIYWKYERLIRKSESKIGSMLGGTDSTYAIRKELFSKLPDDLILDDVYLPMKTVQKGYRAIFEHKAKFTGKTKEGVRKEFRRKTRNLSGNFQILLHLKWLGNPFKSIITWQFFSHKFLRLVVPFLLAAVFISNMYLLDSGFYRGVFFMQAAFYVLAILGFLMKSRFILFNAPYMFCMMNCAAVVGLFRFLRGRSPR